MAGETVYTGAVDSYTDTDPHVRCIEDLIRNVSPQATPFVKRIGINSIKNPAVFSTKYEWLEDTLAPTSSVCDTIDSTDGTTVTCSTANDSKFFRVGHLIRIDDETMWVSASDYAGDLTVTRAFGGSTATTHATGATIAIVGIAMIEGADAVTGFKTDISTGYNYVQLFQDTVQVTGTQDKLKQYGIAGEMDYQMSKKFKELAVLLERSCINGKRAGGSASTARGMGGIPQFITDNVTTNSDAAITENILVDEIQNIFDDVGAEYIPDLIMCNGWVHRKIADFYAASARMERAERTGGVWVNEIDTQFGRLDLMLNLWCPSDELWLLNTDMISIGPFRPFEEQDLAKSGDYTKKQIVGEYTMKIVCDTAHGGITGISTSS